MERAVETYRGVVNTWECDEMGHMNVRFYMTRAVDGMHALLVALGLGPRTLRESVRLPVTREHHVRFHRETHPGHALVMRGGVVQADAQHVELYQELWRDDQVLCATFRSVVALADATSLLPAPWTSSVLHRAQALLVTVPEHGRARGIELVEPRPLPTLEQADALGLFHVYRGRVATHDVDVHGRMLTESFMGRISDGVPHFFQQLGGLARDPQQGVGGAALEYRLVYRAWPRAGDLLQLRSGLKGHRGKTTHFCHWMFDVESGACVMTSEAIAVLFDLQTRKAMAPPPDVIAHMNEQARPELSV